MRLSFRPRWKVVVVDIKHRHWEIRRHECFWTLRGAERRAEQRAEREPHFNIMIIDRFSFGVIVWARYADK